MTLDAQTHVTPTLDGAESVSLLPFRAQDISETYVAWLNDAEVVRYTEVRGRQTLDGVRAYVESQIASRDVYFWRIVAEGRHIGNLRVSGLASVHRRPVIALIIGEKRSRGRGVGTTAIRLASDYLLDSGLGHKVVAGIYSENIPSIRAFEKAGFHIEATFKDHYWFEGRFIDGVEMAKFRTASGGTDARRRREVAG